MFSGKTPHLVLSTGSCGGSPSICFKNPPHPNLSSSSGPQLEVEFQLTGQRGYTLPGYWDLGPRGEGDERYLRIYLDPLQILGCCC